MATRTYRSAVRSIRHIRRESSLQVLLWTVWTIAVVAAGVQFWCAQIGSGHTLDLIGLAIRCVVVGVIGLVVLTKLEMTLQPWRFIDDR